MPPLKLNKLSNNNSMVSLTAGEGPDQYSKFDEENKMDHSQPQNMDFTNEKHETQMSVLKDSV